MRLTIRYRSQFTYDAPVWESQNELRACPASNERQRLLSYRVQVAPVARVLSFTDYWGTRVDAFGVRRPHTSLEVTAEAAVETVASVEPVASEGGTGLAELHAPAFVAAHAEYLSPTRHTAWDDDLLAEARRLRDQAGPDVIAIVHAVHRRVFEALRYDTDATEIGTSAHEVWDRQGGVCQDYAHLAIALCRAIGLPARYVSGYLFAADTSGVTAATGDVVEVATHAWFEAAVPAAGWVALDPTNGRPVGEEHVEIGRGRDYDDVTPLHGVHSGSAAVELDAVVEIRRGEQVAGREGRTTRVATRPLGAAATTLPTPAGPPPQQQQQQQQ